MILRFITGFILTPILGCIALITIALGVFFVSEQNSGPLDQFIHLNGREAVLLGIGLLAAGVSCMIFYLATWFLAVPLSVIGTLLVLVGFSLRSADNYVPKSIMDGYVVEPVTGLVDTYAKPVIDNVIKPLIKSIDSIES